MSESAENDALRQTFPCVGCPDGRVIDGSLLCPDCKPIQRRGGVPHDHMEYVEGCFRCDLSRDESAVKALAVTKDPS